MPMPHVRLPIRFSRPRRGPRLAAGLALLLAGCASVGPDFQPPQASPPADWQARPAGARDLSGSLPLSSDRLPDAWWRGFGDATLDALQARAVRASPDLQAAALRFAQSRLQRRMVASQQAPHAVFNAQATRQRQSEHGVETRLVSAIGGANAPQLIEVLSDPFSLYQGGFDVSWELDLWGRVRRSVESADAGVQAAAAQLRDARRVLASELARAYFELRRLQRQQALLAREAAIGQELLELAGARAANGLSDQEPALAQAQGLAALQARQVSLRAQEAAAANQIALLTGDVPGALEPLLGPIADARDADAPPTLPPLALGQPADLLRQRPDVRAAEARLHQATAEIGIAVADLYPRIALGGSASVQSMATNTFAEWASRSWQIGPVLSLPIFDQGRRRATVELRRADQQAAAVAWRQRVLQAWQELDDALNEHAAERMRNDRLRARESASREQSGFAHARAANGLVSDAAALQAEQTWRQAQADLADSDARLRTTLVRVYKAAGGGVEPASSDGPA